MFPGMPQPEPFKFDGQLNDEELAIVEEIRAEWADIYSNLPAIQLAGLEDVPEEVQARLQALAEKQEDLARQAFDRIDPGAERRKAHSEKEMERVGTEMEKMLGFNPFKQPLQGHVHDENCDHDPYDGETVENIASEKPSLIGKLKRALGFGKKPSNEDEEII